MSFAPKAAWITGGGTGIGRALAEAFMQRGIDVIISGRRADVLQTVCEANPGMRHVVVDVAKPQSVQSGWRQILAQVPHLDCVVNNAGTQRMHDFAAPGQLELTFADAELDTNLRGVVMVTAAVLPHLKKQPSASIINITSALALVPLARMPIYCASKAAVRSLTLSLRHQLAATSVRIIEISPPAVQTDLHDYMGPHGKNIGIPVADFTAEAMQALDGGAVDIAVGQAKMSQQVVAPYFQQAFAAMNGR